MYDQVLKLIEELESFNELSTPGPWHWWMSEGPPFQLGAEDVADIGIQTAYGSDAALICILKNNLDIVLEALRDKAKALDPVICEDCGEHGHNRVHSDRT